MLRNNSIGTSIYNIESKMKQVHSIHDIICILHYFEITIDLKRKFLTCFLFNAILCVVWGQEQTIIWKNRYITYQLLSFFILNFHFEVMCIILSTPVTWKRLNFFFSFVDNPQKTISWQQISEIFNLFTPIWWGNGYCLVIAIFI